MKQPIKTLSIIATIATTISALVGLFYSYGGALKTVRNIYGQEIVLYGDGIYANNSLLKVGATKGTDIVMILICICLLIAISALADKPYAPHLQTGLLSCLLYSSTCLIMGVSFNRLFPVYLLQFSCSLFAFILSLANLLKVDCFVKTIYQIKLKCTAVFLLIGGCSVLIWLTFIVPAIMIGVPTNFIEIYTTEPTFAIDLGIILPSCIYCGLCLLRKKEVGYKLASVLLTLVTCVGACVIFQTVMQRSLGIVLNAGQIIGMVLSFVILGAVAIILNIRLLKYAKCHS